MKTKKIILIVITVLSFSSCIDTPKDMVLPNWDVDVNLPITSKTYTLVDIIDPNSNPNLTISEEAGSDSLYVLMANDLEDTSPIADNIMIPIKVIPENLDISGTGTGNNDIIYTPDKDYRIDSAEFYSGSFYLELENRDNTSSLNYKIWIPGFKKKTDKSVLSIEGSLNPGEIRYAELPITDYRYAQLKKYAYNSDSTQRADGILIRGKAVVNGTQEIKFYSRVANSKITFSRIVGKIKKTELSYQKTRFDNSFGKQTIGFNSKINFKSIRMNLLGRTIGTLRNFKIILDSLSIMGQNKLSNGSLGSPYYLRIQGKEYFTDTLIAGTDYNRIFTEINTNLSDFLSKFPDVITVGSKVILDNITPNSAGAVSNKDSIRFNIDLTAPMIISVADAGFTDTLEVDISDNDREDIVKSNSANLTIEIQNSIPLGLMAKCTFTDRNYNPLFSIKNSVDNKNEFLISPASVDINGIPISSVNTKLNCVLVDDDFEKFKQAEFIIIELKIRSTGSTSSTFGPFVQVRAKDWLKFRVYGGVNYNLDLEDEGGN
ncbi:MAG: hypothetical protein C4539_07515 [Ignavibacteriales bacterium]|nr:MAG: hypothetical protein C4539_07515 [Ignavibacteriales bacterium]